MKEKILNALKQAYSSLGLSDAILSLHAGMLADSGAVNDENLAEIVGKQNEFLKGLQSENDKRVNNAVETARKKFEDETHKAEEERKKKADEDKAKRAAEKAERERIEKLEGFEKTLELFKLEQKQQREAENEAWEKRFAELIEKNKLAETNAADLKQQLDAKTKSDQAAARKAFVEQKARALGISDSRINEGFLIADDLDEGGIANYLQQVANNQKTQFMPQRGAGHPIKDMAAPSKEDIDSIAASMLR